MEGGRNSRPFTLLTPRRAVDSVVVKPENRETVMAFQTHQLFDHLFLTAFVLSGGEHVVLDRHEAAVNFLLDPGGPDYVGVNSYDLSSPAAIVA